MDLKPQDPDSTTQPVELRITRRFAASAERVFDAWLDPAKACHFLFATPNGIMNRVEIDARVGGRFVIVDLREADGEREEIEHVGEYLELERPRRLVFTLCVPKYSEDHDTIYIDIAPLEQGCELTLSQVIAPNWVHIADDITRGWNMILDGLAKVSADA